MGVYEVTKKAIEKLGLRHKVHIAAYGEGNEQRLIGKHETADINNFLRGVPNRFGSVRVRRDTKKAGKGKMFTLNLWLAIAVGVYSMLFLMAAAEKSLFNETTRAINYTFDGSQGIFTNETMHAVYDRLIGGSQGNSTTPHPPINCTIEGSRGNSTTP